MPVTLLSLLQAHGAELRGAGDGHPHGGSRC